MNLCAALWNSIEQYPERPAIQDSEEVNYKQLGSRIESFSGALAARGLKKGDRIALLLPNSPAFVVSFYAALRLGAIVVPLSPEMSHDEFNYVCEDAGIRFFVAHRLPAERENLISPQETGSAPPPAQIDPDEAAVLIYTSGTTGRPKGATLSHRNLVSNAKACESAFQITPEDSGIALLPLYHSFAMTVVMNLPLLAGGRMVIVDRPNPKAIMTALWERKVSVLVGIPALYSLFNKAPEGTSLPPSLRLCISGGAPLPPSVQQRFLERYDVPLLEGYGLSEASPVVACNHPSDPRPGTIGRPLPGVSVRVVREDNSECETGEIGELLVRGENVMKGYWNRPEETAEVLRDGWLRTGDLAAVDEDGFIRIKGRRKELIIRRGYNVYPSEVEHVLASHPAVNEAAVVGREDERDGEIPVAFVSLHDGAEVKARDLIEHCRGALSNYKVPAAVRICPEFPRTPAGKIMKRKLTENGPACQEMQ